MQGTRKLTLLMMAALLAMAGSALAGGFSIYESGARATALGGAFTATADDGSALFYNPAGLSFNQGTNLDLNAMPILPSAKFKGAYGAEGETTDQTFLIPGAYFTHNSGEQLSYGIGLCAPFGLGVQWQDPEIWAGRYSSYNVNLATLYITPAVSYLVNEKTAISLGFDIAWQELELNRYSGLTPGGEGPTSPHINIIDTELSGTSDLNFTPCIGLMYRPDEKLSLGLVYHHEKTMNFEGGTGTLTNVAPDAYAPTVDGLLLSWGGTDYALATELGLPHILALGASYQLNEKLRGEINAVHWGWSNFDQLDLQFSPDTSGRLSTVILEEYEDVWQWRLGLEYLVNEQWTAMAGYVRDKSPQPTASMGPLLPDADRNDFSVGVQYTKDKMKITASYMAVLFDERSTIEDGMVTTFPGEGPSRIYEAGTYSSVANIFGFGFGYSF